MNLITLSASVYLHTHVRFFFVILFVSLLQTGWMIRGFSLYIGLSTWLSLLHSRWNRGKCVSCHLSSSRQPQLLSYTKCSKCNSWVTKLLLGMQCLCPKSQCTFRCLVEVNINQHKVVSVHTKCSLLHCKLNAALANRDCPF